MKHRRTSLSIIALTLLFAVSAANAQTYTRLYIYPSGTGIAVPEQFSQARDGNLYTTANASGTDAFGTVFNMTTAGVPTTIYNFCLQSGCLDGAYPVGGVALGFDGNLYGTTNGGGKNSAGTVFKVTPTGALTTLWNFANGTDESVPIFPLLQAQDGNLYGVSLAQYNGQYGAFFKVSSTGVFSVLHDFSATDGTNPNLPTWSTDGNLYGTAYLGGTPACTGYRQLGKLRRRLRISVQNHSRWSLDHSAQLHRLSGGSISLRWSVAGYRRQLLWGNICGRDNQSRGAVSDHARRHGDDSLQLLLCKRLH